VKTFAFVMLFALAGAAATGESLWARNPPGNMFADTKARKVGDLLTVLIDERATVSNEANRTLNKESTADLGVDAFRMFGLKNNQDSTLPAVKWDAKKDFTGDAEYKSTDTLTKRLTVTVKEVLPNGNLLIEGRRRINTSGDETAMTITGIVRPEDIRADNSVPSEMVAEAKINYDGKGPSADATSRGWFMRILDAIWPF